MEQINRKNSTKCNEKRNFIALILGLIPFISVSGIVFTLNSVLVGLYIAVSSMITSHSMLTTALLGFVTHVKRARKVVDNYFVCTKIE